MAIESVGHRINAYATFIDKSVLGRDDMGSASDEGYVGDFYTKRFTAEAKSVFELSMREALQLGHNRIGIEHIVLALARFSKQAENVASLALCDLGIEPEALRKAVIYRLTQGADKAKRIAELQRELDMLRGKAS